MSASPLRLRSLFQFRLRTLLILITLSGLTVAAYRRTIESYREQHAAAQALTKLGVSLEWRTAPSWLNHVLQHFVEEEVLRDYTVVGAQHRRLSDEDLVWLRAMPHIERLYLAGNPITDAGLRHLSHHRYIERLSLWNTDITNDGMSHIAHLENLKVLDIHDSASYLRLGSASWRSPYSPKIRSATKRYRLTQECLWHLRGLKKLRALYFSFPVDNTGVSHLQALPRLSLRSLKLENVTAEAIDSLPRWFELEMVAVERAALSRTGLQALPRLTLMSQLVLNGVQAEEGTWEPLQHLHNVRQLSLQDCSIGDEGIKHLRSLSQLRGLCIRGTQVTNDGLAYLQNCRALEILDLNDSRVTSPGFRYFRNLKQLRTLYHQGPLEDVGLSALAELPNLRLSIPAPRVFVTDAGLRDLAKLQGVPQVRIFDAVAGTPLGLGQANVSTTAGYLTDSGVRSFLENSNSTLIELRARKMTSAALTEWMRADTGQVRIQAGYPPDEFFTEELPGWETLLVRRDGVAVSNTRLASEADFRELRSNLEITFADTLLGLPVIRHFPGVAHLSLDPDIDAPSRHDHWKYLEHAQDLRSLEMPGRSDSSVVVDSEALQRIGEMRLLERLVLNMRGQEVVDLSPLANLSYLKHLELHGKTLDTEDVRIISELGSLKTLMVFARGRSLSSPDDVELLTRLESLKELCLYGLTNESLRYIAQIPNLELLTISGQEITDEGSRFLVDLHELRYLDARGTGISNQRLRELNKSSLDRNVRTDR